MRHERKRKRGRRRDGDEHDDDREEEERLRLVRTLSTSIRRAGKVARAHETTRTVRRLKERREALERLERARKGGGVEGDGDDGDGGDDREAPPPGDEFRRDEGDLERAIRRARRKVSSLERRLDLVKGFEVDVLVGVCMRRLGLAGVGVDVDAVVASMGSSRPRPAGRRQRPQQVQTQKQVVDGDREEEDDEEEAKCNDGETGPREASAEEIELVESMLLHKKLSSTMDALNERVTEYRRTLMRRKDGEGDEVEDLGRGSNGRNRCRRQHMAVGRQNWSRKAPATSGSGSLFVGSLSGGAEDEEPNGDDGAGGDDYFRYGPGAVLDDYADVVKPRKKNRKGQRARRAKAIAEEARRQGKRWDSSINWREKKKKGKKGRLPNDADGGDGVDTSAEASSASGLRAEADVKASEVAEMGKSWKEEGKAHPSWAAKHHAKQQTGIVKFAGKKITFD